MDATYRGHGTNEWTIPQPCEKAWAATPTLPGVYKWFLQGNLPIDFDWPPGLIPINRGDLIYIGRATSLRTRAKHHKIRTSTSTLRRALASLMGLQAEWRGSSAHPGLVHVDEVRLTSWMTDNLSMSFMAVESSSHAGIIEKSLRASLKPPLNRDGLTPEQRHISTAAAAMQRNALGRQGSRPSGSAKESESRKVTLRTGPSNPERNAMTERMNLTKTLYQQGWTRTQIAERVGVHSSTVGDYIAKLRYRGELDQNGI